MKYIWIEKETASELSNLLGCQVKSIKRGALGDEPDAQMGVEIDLEDETPEIIQRLDLIMGDLERVGGRTIDKVIVDNIVLEYPNPNKEAYKLSQLYGLTHEQLDTYIDSNVTNLAEAKQFMRKMAHVILWLVKQTKLDE